MTTDRDAPRGPFVSPHAQLRAAQRFGARDPLRHVLDRLPSVPSQDFARLGVEGVVVSGEVYKFINGAVATAYRRGARRLKAGRNMIRQRRASGRNDTRYYADLALLE